MGDSFFGFVLYSADDFTRLVVRLALNLVFVSLVVGGIYYRLHRRRDYVFTYLIFNIITFSMCFLLVRVPIELGFASVFSRCLESCGTAPRRFAHVTSPTCSSSSALPF
ncbi:MAG: DUF4956 domain-containing protein [Polyangiales bacterium]|nr:DUF4956 domain-containing protein [Myxococcales bacterium]